FSLGIVLFECLAGRMPFTDESPLGLMLEVVKAEIPDVRTLNSEVDPELERILSKMVAKDPADRYQSCQDLVADLGRHPAIVASGATLSLPVQAAPVERPRATRTTNVHPLAPATDATFSTEPPTSQRLAASRPLLRQPALRPLPSHGKRNAAIAATALLAIAAGAWAFRGDLSLAPTPADNAPSLASVTTPSPLAGAPEVARSSASTVYDDYVPVDAQAPRASPTAANDAADPALLDDEWLGDVPDAAFDADGYDYASAAYSAAPGSPPPPYAPVVYYPPYAVPVVPVAYYAPSPWRFGFGMTLGFGTGWWTTRYYAPVYFGPVVSPIAVAPRPLPGTVASANPAVATATPANRPLPSTSAPSAPSRSAATRTPVGAQSARSEAPERALAKNNVQALQGQQLARREQRMAQMQQARRERMQAQAEQQRQARREMQVEERREAQAKRQQAAERAGHPHPHPRPKEHRY
ncbi:MAG: hypothetical protein JSR27_05670, partial [Proteobacteria bacterium]|nr:hypothetical protein [Pseudomonadota bacterium]